MTDSMQQARIDIAAAHRLAARMGFNEGFNGGHFTLMAPTRRDLVLTIANGTHWQEVRPDNVIAIDMAGNTVEGAGQVEDCTSVTTRRLARAVISRVVSIPLRRWRGPVRRPRRPGSARSAGPARRPRCPAPARTARSTPARRR